MTTTEWLRSKIGPSPNPALPDRIARFADPRTDFFARYLKPDMQVLHAYCGDGRATFGLSVFLPAGSVTGIDPDIANLRKSRSYRFAEEPGQRGDVTFERCSLDDLPFGPDEFDAVLLDGPFATERSPERALEQVKRVLAPGGLLGARHTVAASRIFTARSALLARALERQEEALRDLGGDPDAGVRQPTLLREAGFVNLRVTSSTEQSSDDDLLAELTKAGFVLPDDEASEPLDDESPPVFSFVTAVETVCWKPA